MTPPIRNKWCATHPNGKLHKNIQAASGNKLLGFVIHQTANLNPGADAEAHARLQYNGNVRVASWHATCDDTEVWRSWQKQVRCWSAGSGALDYYAVEICVNSDGNYTKCLANAAAFIAWVHVNEGVPLVLKQHNAFTGKNCPTQIRASQGGISWARFCALIRDEVAVLRADPRRGRDSARWCGTTPAPAPAPKPADTRPLGRNTTKRSVAEIQRRVGVKDDGVYGRDTTAAVIAFQKANGLEPDGIWGPKTDAKGFPPAPKSAPAPAPKPAAAAQPVLKVGSKGAAVTKLQKDLNRTFPAYSKLNPDGDFGAKTKAVVADFQRRSGLSPDGVVGPNTWAALAKHGIEP